MKHAFVFLVCASLLLSCDLDSKEFDHDIGLVMGYKPVYAESEEQIIGIEPAKPIELAGKIYSYQNLLIVNEVAKGIHIYDNTDPANPQNMMYVSIPGNHDVAIKNGILYADSFGDILAIEVTPDTVKVIKRVEGVMNYSTEVPPVIGSYFECIDESKGIVIGWEETEIENPKCYRP